MRCFLVWALSILPLHGLQVPLIGVLRRSRRAVLCRGRPRWVDGPSDIVSSARVSALDKSVRADGNAVAVLYFSASNAISADCSFSASSLSGAGLRSPEHAAAVAFFEDLGPRHPKVQFLLAARERDDGAFGAFERLPDDDGRPVVEILYKEARVALVEPIEAAAALEALGFAPQEPPVTGGPDWFEARATAAPPENQPGLRAPRTTARFFPSPEERKAPPLIGGIMKRQDEQAAKAEKPKKPGVFQQAVQRREKNNKDNKPLLGGLFAARGERKMKKNIDFLKQAAGEGQAAGEDVPAPQAMKAPPKVVVDPNPPVAPAQADADDEEFGALFKKKKQGK